MNTTVKRRKDIPDKIYLARCLRQLKEWGAPLDGWYCTGIIDVHEDDYDAPLSACELCGCVHVRYEHVMENDIAPWITIGTMELEILEYYPILDLIDPMTGDMLDEYVVYRGDKLKELLQDPDAIGFNVKNTDVVYDWNNQIVLIMREFSPAQ